MEEKNKTLSKILCLYTLKLKTIQLGAIITFHNRKNTKKIQEKST